jgi:two-component system LytT family response regulator
MPDSTIRVVIVDDEELARRVLFEHLAAHPDVLVVAECGNGFEAVKAVSEARPDLLFLDVQMPKLDGFEVLELIGREVAVVFVTAYDEYAIRAFQVHAVDYLLKPFGAERLAEALDQVRRRRAAGAASAVGNADAARPAAPPPAVLAAAARPPGRFAERIVVRDGSRVHVIPVHKLDFVQAQDDYVCLLSEGRRFLKEQTMAEIEDALDPARFVRIHRSYILNLERLTRVEPYGKDTRVAILVDGSRLPVSRSGYARLNELLK